VSHSIRVGIIGKQDQPYAQLLQLGWAIIGESCLDGVHGQSSVNVLKTMLKGRGAIHRPSMSLHISLSIIERKALSSIEIAGLLSFSDC
jgi:hypothetical protein